MQQIGLLKEIKMVNLRDLMKKVLGQSLVQQLVMLLMYF
nr:MAG TPA: hypothetical protein [Crassvirales sp.]